MQVIEKQKLFAAQHRALLGELTAERRELDMEVANEHINFPRVNRIELLEGLLELSRDISVGNLIFMLEKGDDMKNQLTAEQYIALERHLKYLKRRARRPSRVMKEKKTIYLEIKELEEKLQQHWKKDLEKLLLEYVNENGNLQR